MTQQQWFYRTDEEWNAFAEHLKHLPCPHCRTIGNLIKHSLSYGFDEAHPRPTLRARRIYCSNRHARRGCGRTFSVWLADKIRRLSLTTTALWRFLQHAAAGSVRAAIRALGGRRSDRTWWRVWKRFHLGQSKIRTALSGCCPPPPVPAGPGHPAAAPVCAHLQNAFPRASCPITAFQHTLRTFFV